MSNYNIPPRDAVHEVMVGWDPQMNTFFAHVIDQTKDEDEEGRDVLWIGCDPNEIHDVEVLRAKLQNYALLSEDILSTLYREAHA